MKKVMSRRAACQQWARENKYAAFHARMRLARRS